MKIKNIKILVDVEDEEKKELLEPEKFVCIFIHNKIRIRLKGKRI